MQSGRFDEIEYRYLARQLGDNLLRTIQNYTSDRREQQILFDIVNEKFPLDVNNIPVGNFPAPAA